MSTASWALVAVLAGGPPSGGHVSRGDPRNEAVMPPQRIRLEFDHSLHLTEAGLECLDCHGAVARSERTKDYNIPERQVCLDCHDEDEIPWRWMPSPRARDNAVAIPAAHLKFSHRRHLEIDGVACLDCHAGVPEAGLATRDHLPAMETCLGCHDGQQAAGECATCHLEGAGGTLRTTFRSGELVPDDHGVHWLKQHEVHGERELAYCASCHAQEDCLSCHDGSIPPTIHDGNYLAQHPRDGLANSPPCASCHRLDVFCRDCHARAGVRTGVRLPSFTESFHPAGWVFSEGTPQHHAHVARKNLAACSACHDGQNCKSCHEWLGAFSPRTHGPGWRGSDRMRRLRRENFSLCLQCHDASNPDDPVSAP